MNRSIEKFAEDMRGRKLALSESWILIMIVFPIVMIALAIASDFSEKKIAAFVLLGVILAFSFCLVWYLSINIGPKISIVSEVIIDGENKIAKELAIRNWFGFELAKLNNIPIESTYNHQDCKFAVLWLREFEVVAMIA